MPTPSESRSEEHLPVCPDPMNIGTCGDWTCAKCGFTQLCDEPCDCGTAAHRHEPVTLWAGRPTRLPVPLLTKDRKGDRTDPVDLIVFGSFGIAIVLCAAALPIAMYMDWRGCV